MYNRIKITFTGISDDAGCIFRNETFYSQGKGQLGKNAINKTITTLGFVGLLQGEGQFDVFIKVGDTSQYLVLVRTILPNNTMVIATKKY